MHAYLTQILSAGRHWIRARRPSTPRLRPSVESLEDRTILAIPRLDPAFGSAGIALVGLEGMFADMALQADGKILVAGTRTLNNDQQLVVARLNSDGRSLDRTFGDDGVFLFAQSNMASEATAIAVDGNSIVVAGFARTPGADDLDYLLVRLTSGGTLDASFGIGVGFTRLDAGGVDVARDLVVDANRSYVVLGETRFSIDDTVSAVDVVRFNSSGGPDTSFGADPVRPGIYRRESGFGTRGTSIVTQNEGYFVAGSEKVEIMGPDGLFVPTDMVLVLRLDGRGEAEFVGPGVPLQGVATGLAVQADARAIIGWDRETSPGNRTSFIARIDADGRLDTTFSDRVDDTVPVAGVNALSGTTRVAVSDSDEVIVMGQTRGDAANVGRTFVARYRPTGIPDDFFGTSGVAISNLTVEALFPLQGLLPSNDTILIAGIDDTLTGAKVARLLARTPTTLQLVSDRAGGGAYGQTVSLTATAAATAPDTDVPTGTVQFVVDGTNRGAPVVLTNGRASVQLTDLAAGAHTIAASYTSDVSLFANSTAAPLNQQIAPAPLTVTATGMSRVYNGTTSASATLADNRIGNDQVTLSFASASFADRNVGQDKQIQVNGISLSGPDAGNYVLQDDSTTTTAEITPAPLTVTAAGVSRVYNGTTSATITLADNRIGNDQITLSFASASFADKNVSQDKQVQVNGISLSGPDAGNYALQNDEATTTASVTPAALTITANDVTATVGQLPTLTARYAGLVGNDTELSLAVRPLLSTAATASSPAGRYAVNVAGAADPNYAIAFVAGNLTLVDAATSPAQPGSPSPSTSPTGAAPILPNEPTRTIGRALSLSAPRRLIAVRGVVSFKGRRLAVHHSNRNAVIQVRVSASFGRLQTRAFGVKINARVFTLSGTARRINRILNELVLVVGRRHGRARVVISAADRDVRSAATIQIVY